MQIIQNIGIFKFQITLWLKSRYFSPCLLPANKQSVAELPKGIVLKETFLSPALETKVSDSSERTFIEIAIKAPLNQTEISFTRRPYVQLQPKLCKNKIEIQVTILGQPVILYRLVEPIWMEVNENFTLKYPGTFKISSQVGSEPFELNILARSSLKLRALTKSKEPFGIRFFFMKKKPVYSIQAEFALLINEEERLRHAIDNSRSDRQYRGARIKIDPNHLYDMKILEDF